MLQTDTQNVVYVGKKKVKRDTVAGTGLVWCGFGDTHRVPHSSAVRLFRHPDVWVSEKVFAEAYKDESDAPDIAPVITSEGVALVPAQGLSDVAPAPAPASEEDPDGELSDEGEAGEISEQGTSSVNRELAIKNALLSLDQSNAEHFSEQTGAPLVKAVREAAGDATISVKDMNAAWAAIQAGSK